MGQTVPLNQKKREKKKLNVKTVLRCAIKRQQLQWKLNYLHLLHLITVQWN